MTAVAGAIRKAGGTETTTEDPPLTRQTMIAGRKFGQSAGAEVQREMIEQLRNQGHAL